MAGSQHMRGYGKCLKDIADEGKTCKNALKGFVKMFFELEVSEIEDSLHSDWHLASICTTASPIGAAGLFLGVRKGLKMILSHMAPSCLNMSSYRAMWSHFRLKHLDVFGKLFLGFSGFWVWDFS